jgi:hypothetical protein
MVESKRRRRNLVALILGMNVAQAVRQGMIVESIASQPGSFQSEAEEPLFVSDDETQESAPAPKFGSQFGASTNAFGTQNNQLNATPQPTGFFGLGSQANSHLSPTASPFNPLPSFASSTVSFPVFVAMFRDLKGARMIIFFSPDVFADKSRLSVDAKPGPNNHCYLQPVSVRLALKLRYSNHRIWGPKNRQAVSACSRNILPLCSECGTQL